MNVPVEKADTKQCDKKKSQSKLASGQRLISDLSFSSISIALHVHMDPYLISVVDTSFFFFFRNTTITFFNSVKCLDFLRYPSSFAIQKMDSLGLDKWDL